MRVAVYLMDGRICYFEEVETVVMHAAGETRHPLPGMLVLSPVTTVGWVVVDAQDKPLPTNNVPMEAENV